MDPNAAAAIMRDDLADLADRVDAALSIRQWLAAGGFPQSIPGRTFGGNTAARLAAIAETDTFLAGVRLADDGSYEQVTP